MKKYVAISFLCLGIAWAQAPEMPGHVNLRVLPAMARDVDAYPRVVANAAVSADLAQRLNARFDKLDAALRTMRAECLADGRQRHMGADYTHSVKVTMRGPRFLSVTAEDSYFCGGPHPDNSMEAAVYDLTTGAPVKWSAVLPGAKQADLGPGEADFSHVSWPVLTRRALAEAEPDCKDEFRQGDMDFAVWLDGDRGALVAESVGVSHAMAACVDDLVLNAATLRGLGVKAEIVEALTTAMHDPSPLAVKRRAEAKK